VYCYRQQSTSNLWWHLPAGVRVVVSGGQRHPRDRAQPQERHLPPRKHTHQHTHIQPAHTQPAHTQQQQPSAVFVHTVHTHGDCGRHCAGLLGVGECRACVCAAADGVGGHLHTHTNAHTHAAIHADTHKRADIQQTSLPSGYFLVHIVGYLRQVCAHTSTQHTDAHTDTHTNAHTNTHQHTHTRNHLQQCAGHPLRTVGQTHSRVRRWDN
jgi:hypothetical protein